MDTNWACVHSWRRTWSRPTCAQEVYVEAGLLPVAPCSLTSPPSSPLHPSLGIALLLGREFPPRADSAAAVEEAHDDCCTRERARARERAREPEHAHTRKRQNGGKTWRRHKTCQVWPSDARRESEGRDTGLLLDRNDSGLMRVTVIVTRFPAGFLNISSTCSHPRARADASV